MTSTKPYLIRAIYEWCVDEGFTPYLAVTVNSRTRVPREFVRDGQIVLNVGAEATSKLMMGNDEVSFQARFNGVAFAVAVPVSAVSAIYARENGQGMAFEADDSQGPGDTAAVEELPATTAEGEPSPPPPAGRPHLTRIK